nr:immunoglobulin light chain junction region [Macaca mulatta]
DYFCYSTENSGTHRGFF